MKISIYNLNKITPAKYIIIILIIFLLSSSTFATDTSVQPYLLLYAFDTEGELLAEKMEIPLHKMGKLLDHLNVKVRRCSLGCFQ